MRKDFSSIWLSIYLSFYSCFLCSTLISNTCNASEKIHTISSIHFSGNAITRVSVLRSEMLLTEGQPFDAEKFEQSLQNLRNLRIFRSVSGEVSSTPNDTVHINVTIQEKQTLLPFFRAKQGGGSTLLVLGIGDLNTLGKGFELLPMYENLNGKYHGGRLDTHIPHISNSQLTLDGSVANEARSHCLYSATGGSAGTFVERTSALKIAAEYPLNNSFDILGANSLLQTKMENIEKTTLNTNARIQLSSSIGIGYGHINYNDYRLEGSRITLRFENIKPENSNSSQNMQLETKSFWQPFSGVDIALKTSFFFITNNASLLNNCSIGGFGEVRGFLDERYRGTTCWFANAEFRKIAYSHPWYVLQPTVFADAGRATTNASQKAFQWQKDPASVGGGVRVIFPYLARLILRMDLGVPMSPSETAPSISLGSTQFF